MEGERWKEEEMVKKKKKIFKVSKIASTHTERETKVQQALTQQPILEIERIGTINLIKII